MSAVFIPPFFNKFGKDTTDILKKKFVYDNEFKIIQKSKADGLTVESGGVNAAAGLRGYVKVKKIDQSVGTIEANISTDANTASTASILLPALEGGLKGSEITLDIANSDKKFKNGLPFIFGGKFTHTRESFAALAHLKTDTSSHILDYGVSAGFENISVGLGGSIDLSSGVEHIDNDFGLEYATKDYTASLYTSKNVEEGNLSLFGKLPTGNTAALLTKFNLKNNKVVISGLVDIPLTPETTLKEKIELPIGKDATIEASLEHRLKNPSLSATISAKFNAAQLLQGAVRAENFGFSFAFGDY